MTLDEAIQVKRKYLDANFASMTHEERLADSLSIEALKRIKARRDLKTGWEKGLLPGETEK
jgi:hypothetical protein